MMSGKVNVKMNKDEEVTQLNDYKIGKILGQGAYGIVYKAHGPEHGEVAVKVLNRSVLSKKTQGTGTALDGVLKEIAVMKKLRHPNCVLLWEVTAPTRDPTTLRPRRDHHLHLHLHLHLCRSSTILITTTCTSSWSSSRAATCPRPSRARRKSASHGCASGCVTRCWDSSTCTPSPFCTVTSNQRTYCGTSSCRCPPPLAPSQHCRSAPQQTRFHHRHRHHPAAASLCRQVAKLADFGVSDIQSGGGHKDYVKATAGTPAFFAPEMCGDDKTGSKLYSGRAADLWALGVCLHMWIFLRLPFEAPTVYMLMQASRRRAGPPPPPSNRHRTPLINPLAHPLAHPPTHPTAHTPP